MKGGEFVDMEEERMTKKENKISKKQIFEKKFVTYNLILLPIIEH